MINLLAREVYKPSWLIQTRKFYLLVLPAMLPLFTILGTAGELGWMGGTIMGVVFLGLMALVMPRAMALPMVKLTDGLYYANEEQCGDVPQGDLPYRLLCAIPVAFGPFFPGVLHFGRDRVIFVGRRTWKSNGRRIDFGPANQVTVAREDLPSQWYRRLLRQPEPFLEFRSAARIQKFRLPMPDLALEAIEKALNELRPRGSSADAGQ